MTKFPTGFLTIQALTVATSTAVFGTTMYLERETALAQEADALEMAQQVAIIDQVVAAKMARLAQPDPGAIVLSSEVTPDPLLTEADGTGGSPSSSTPSGGQSASTPSPASTPAPAPAPEPQPEPEPAKKSAPQPAPALAPEPAPAPAPQPAPAPAPEPAPEPAPAPAPEPAPAPAPEPAPVDGGSGGS